MPVSQLVALRNLKRGVTVLTPDRSDPRNFLEFQATGDSGGGDVQYVSEELAASPTVVKAIMHGILALEQDTMSPEVAEAFRQQLRVAQEQRDRSEKDVAAMIDRPDTRDLLGLDCIGPSERAGQRCGSLTAVVEKKAEEQPPLCDRHQGLAHEYVPTEDFDGDKKRTRWVRTVMGARERQAQ